MQTHKTAWKAKKIRIETLDDEHLGMQSEPHTVWLAMYKSPDTEENATILVIQR